MASYSDSPFITEIEFVPPSPEFNFVEYNNSPFSNNSELDFTLFDDNTDYDPSDYDPPHSSSLLMFSDSDYIQHPSYRSSYDYSSPSSTDDNTHDSTTAARSRASSTSSAPNPYSPSPRLEVAQSFENMTFRSPSWNTDPLPSLDRHPHSPLPQKPPSPPRLLIHDQQPPPTINAPDGDGVMGGPQLHIVPATPISGGANGQSSVPFESRLETLHQGSALTPQHHTWGVDQHRPGVNPTGTPSSEQAFFDPSSRNSQANASASSSGLAHLLDDTSSNGGGFLFPAPQRNRSKSDPQLEHPTWETGFLNPHPHSQHNESAIDDNTVNMNDVHQQMHFPSQGHMQGFTFGSSGHDSNNNAFLSPDLQLRRSKSDATGRSGHHGRSRSEDIRSIPVPSQANLHPSHAHSHSLSQGPSNFLFPPTSHTEFINANAPSAAPSYLSPSHTDRSLPPIRSRTPTHGHYRRASSGTRSERGVSAWSNNNNNNNNNSGGIGTGGSSGILSSSARVSPYPSPNASPRPRYDDLPPTSGGYDEVSISGHAAMGAYNPAPHSTTLPRMGGLLDVSGYGPAGAGATQMLQGPGVNPGSVRGREEMPILVSKPNVTTGRTANASHRRRKQEATFVCPVPGCGSTFTRSFNLKGHLRSHNEEKPFQCHWPGCGKGFARQHDCKRHEQLHTNYRPFVCEGCNKQFARMDALNRHLRSEGGAECQRAQDAGAGTGAGAGGGGNASGLGFSSSSGTSSSASATPPDSRGRSEDVKGGRMGMPKMEESWSTMGTVTL